MTAQQALWLFFPDFRASSPYQTQLAQALAPRWQALPASIEQAIEVSGDRPVVFHLAWEETVYRQAADRAQAMALIGRFLDALDALRIIGGRFVWSLHNAAPHEDRFPDLNAEFQAALAARADVAHAHGEAGAALLRAAGAPAGRVLVAPHPSYIDAYPDDITDAQARRYFALEDSAFVFAFFGAMRGYKGLDRLHTAFAAVHATHAATRLILAGRSPEASLARFVSPSPALRIVPRHVDDAVVQYVLRASDCVVLPYRRILTSGAVMLALSFARPVIVPALPPLLEVVQHDREALTYDPDAGEGLVRAMRQACECQAAMRTRMRRSARATAEAVPFAGLAAALAGAVQASHAATAALV